MGSKSAISWLSDEHGPGATWEPTRGCSPHSPGCKFCWAKTYAHRFDGPGLAYEGFSTAEGWTGKVEIDPEHLHDPLHWKRPRRIFVDSRSDLFHEALPDAAIGTVFSIIEDCPQHTFLVLTKRAQRMRTRLARFLEPLGNVWLGVSVDDRKHGLPRIEELRQTPAALRFLSIEPLLEDLGELDLRGIGWVIVGGESGSGARPFHLAWACSLRDQCKAAGVPFFMKQIGARPVVRRTNLNSVIDDDWDQEVKPKHKAGADPAEWPKDLRRREFPEVAR